ncbi:hypothetical protein [Thalassomonas sp. RHCl1]|uniref:hypothetical protein n=1 Tax=Thalassomonas sp. RHCl1 TaxID=2995320 RepID=UPI00248C90B1|nr:hypothetical protein [Thalassomonas sp. RHCl1]
MNKVKSVVILICMVVSLQVSAKNYLDEESVNNLMENIIEAVHTKNLEQLASSFSDDVKIIMDLPAEFGGKETLTKDQYLELTQESWAMPGDFTYEVLDLNIVLSNNKTSAIVTDKVVETIVLNGKLLISTTSDESFHIVIEDGLPKVEIVYAKLRVNDL